MGLAGMPPAVTRTEATGDPALGFAGEILTALATTADPVLPEPPEPPPVLVGLHHLEPERVAVVGEIRIRFRRLDRGGDLVEPRSICDHAPSPATTYRSGWVRLQRLAADRGCVARAAFGRVGAVRAPTKARGQRHSERDRLHHARGRVDRDADLEVEPCRLRLLDETASPEELNAEADVVRGRSARRIRRDRSRERCRRKRAMTCGMPDTTTGTKETPTTPKAEGRDLVTRLADAGEEALQRIAELPGGQRALGAFNDLRARVDDLGKRVRGIEALEERVAKLEKEVASLKKSKAPPRKPTTSATPTPPSSSGSS
jgi:hypothetical protein